MPRIVFKNNAHEAMDFIEAITLGRSEKHANVVLDDKRLSRAHCRIEPRDDAWAVVDLDSQNGTFLNGRRVREAAVRAGDVITIGAVDFSFEADGPGGSTVMAGMQTGTRASGLDLEGATPTDPVEDSQSTRTVVAPAALILTQGTLADKIHPLVQDPFVVGRKADANLCLDGDNKASGHHARISRRGEQYVIEDLDSRNGTTVNGTKIDGAVVLKPGMRIVIGSQAFQFQLQGQPLQSSGATAPKLAKDAVDRELGREAGETPVGEASEAEMEAAEEEDRAALTQQVKFKGGGGKVFALLEVVVVVAVAAGLLFGAWTLTQTGGEALGTNEQGYAPARDSGLLPNGSFDERDEGGYPRGWRYLVSGTDSFALVEGSHGGPYALQLSRYTTAHQTSFAISDPVDVTSNGISVSAYVLNPDLRSQRGGVAIVQVWWLEHPRDRDPIGISPISVGSGYGEWTEVSGSAVAPRGARAYCIAVGIGGAPGSVMFDDILVGVDDNATDWFRDYSVNAPGNMTWTFSRTGNITLAGTDDYIENARVLLFQTESRTDPLDPMLYLTAAPGVEVSATTITARLAYFDLIASAPAELVIQMGGLEGVTRFSAAVETTGGDGLSRHVALSGTVTSAWMPSEVVRYENTDVPQDYTMDLGMRDQRRAAFGRLLATDTGRGNVIRTPQGASARVWLESSGGLRHLFMQAPSRLALEFVAGGGTDELADLMAVVLGAQGDDHLARIDSALKVFEEFSFNHTELTQSAEAIDTASKHYRLRLIELRDGVDAPQLTRNEQMYRSAMQEAINTADRLRESASSWQQDSVETLQRVGGEGMSRRSRDAARKANQGLAALIQLATEFDALAERARRSLFELEVEIEQRESEPFMISARDFLAQGQYVQGMLQLMEVVRNYPRCLRGVEAKERLADVAEILLNEMEDYQRQNLRSIARDNAVQARDLIRLVRRNLLSNLLDQRQRQWLAEIRVSAEAPANTWMTREVELTRRLNQLEGRLPQDVRESGDEAEED